MNNNNNNKRREKRREEEDKSREIFGVKRYEHTNTQRGYCSMNSNLVFKSMTRADSHSTSSSFCSFRFQSSRDKKNNNGRKFTRIKSQMIHTMHCIYIRMRMWYIYSHLTSSFYSDKMCVSSEVERKSNHIRKIQIFCFNHSGAFIWSVRTRVFVFVCVFSSSFLFSHFIKGI